LLRLTFERFLPICPVGNIYIVTNEAYRDLVKQHLPELDDRQIIGEPSRNNTAPCIAYTALKLSGLNPDGNMIVSPADHVVLKEAAFHEKIKQALDFAGTHDALLTLGIRPTRVDTGYGYIQFEKEQQNGVHKVARFTEKPDTDTARKFVESGDYLWNAGIFIWSLRSIQQAFERLAPQIYNLLSPGQPVFNTPGETAFIQKHYPNTPDISIDFAIMEKAPNVYTLPAEFGWSDLGTWASLHAECPKDDQGNVLQGAHIISLDTRDCLVRAADEKLVVVKDLQGYMVVDEPDVLLIYPKSKEQEIKQLRGQVERRFGEKFI
ncbi:MAG: mannose-1-phosphate guanylyltransferase, partial [Saprospiraceae bacterium]|nr:mannose-1-phosphate guanylyltransferase [Saprospiraceae bacterium]